METTIRILAWIGLVVVVIGGIFTLIAWGDWLVTRLVRRGLESRGIFRVIQYWINLEVEGHIPDASYMAYQIHYRFELLCKDNPAVALEFYKRLKRHEHDPWMPKEEKVGN